MKYFILVISIFLATNLFAQEASPLLDHAFTVNSLDDPTFQEFINKKLHNTQFIFVGEQHGIKEVGVLTNALYNLGKPRGYNTLCVETDSISALSIARFAASPSPIEAAMLDDAATPMSMPFYNNEDDYELFINVANSKGDIWGIDRPVMTQFRYNFQYLIDHTQSQPFKGRLETLKKQATADFEKAMAEKDFMAPYIFKFDEKTYDELLNMAATGKEKEIIRQLWKTKLIYSAYFAREIYENNRIRAGVMKRNFMGYYRNALKQSTAPKVILKMGAYHAKRGLNEILVYDIANMVSELAESNGMRSLHFFAGGISGKQHTGNPFAPDPVIEFDNMEELPEEVKQAIAGLDKKYFVLDLEPLRKKSKKYSEDFKAMIFGYDILVLTRDAEALRSF